MINEVKKAEYLIHIERKKRELNGGCIGRETQSFFSCGKLTRRKRAEVMGNELWRVTITTNKEGTR